MREKDYFWPRYRRRHILTYLQKRNFGGKRNLQIFWNVCKNSFWLVIVVRKFYNLEFLNTSLEQMTNSEFVAKTLNQPHATEVGEVGFVEGKMNFSGTFWHVSQSTFLRRFLTRDLFDHYYSIFSLAIRAFSWRKNSRFTHFWGWKNLWKRRQPI